MDGQSRLLLEIGKKRIGAVQGFALSQRFLPGCFALDFLVGRDFTRRDFALGDFEEGFAELNLRLSLGVVVFHGCISKYSNSSAKRVCFKSHQPAQPQVLANLKSMLNANLRPLCINTGRQRTGIDDPFSCGIDVIYEVD